MPKHSTSLRDAALRRLEHSNRWLVAGSVVLTAVFADIAANAFPGKTLKASSASKGNAHTGSSKTTTQPVKPPVQAPTATPEGEAKAEEPPASSEPSQESVPSQESTPSQESPPAESAPPSSEPSTEAAPEPTPAPAEQQAPPVVSGGS
jgi:outer membrane biosynthesis protein TonB